MNILAIDPGNKESAYCIWDGERIATYGKVTNEYLKEEVLGEFSIMIFPDDKVVIEMIASYGMPVGKEVFETVLFIGRLLEWCEINKLDCELVYRKDVKIHFCNSMKAKDSNIRQALVDRFGGKGTKKNKGLTYGISKDVWQAFAIAVFYYDTHVKEVV